MNASLRVANVARKRTQTKASLTMDAVVNSLAEVASAPSMTRRTRKMRSSCLISAQDAKASATSQRTAHCAAYPTNATSSQRNPTTIRTPTSNASIVAARVTMLQTVCIRNETTVSAMTADEEAISQDEVEDVAVATSAAEAVVATNHRTQLQSMKNSRSRVTPTKQLHSDQSMRLHPASVYAITDCFQCVE